MLDTAWKLTLKNAASGPAKRITRDVLALTAALRGLGSVSDTAQSSLAKVGGGVTAGRLRAQTSLVREQTKALREQRATTVQKARDDRSAAVQRARETKQQLDAHKAVARLQNQNAAAARRSQAQAAGGRTRLDVAAMTGRTRMDLGAAPAGRTRMDLGSALAGAGGRTRVDVADLGGRTRAEGPTAGEFQARARALQIAHNTKVAALAERAANRNAANAARAHKREEAETARHYRGIFSSAQRNARALERLNARNAAQAQRASARAAAAQSRSRTALSSSAFSLFGSVASVAMGAAAALAGVAVGFAGIGLAAAGAVIEVAAFRESSLTALEAVLGSSGAAGRQFRNAVTVANQTPLDTQDVIRQTQSFAVAGFGEREIAPLIAASADLGAAFGQRSSEGFALALSQIRATGTLQGQELLQLTNANVSRSAVLDSVARQMHLGEGAAGRRAAMKAISKRRVSSGVGEQAALDAVRGRLDQGGQLGSFARRQSETLTGAISNARNAIFNLLIGIDFSRVPGLIAFKNVLLQITGALQSGSPAASALRQGIMGAANAMGGLLARAINPATIAAGMASVGRGLATVQRFGAMALPIVRAFADGFGPAFTASIAPLRSLFASLTSGGPTSARTLSLLATSARGLGQILGFVVGTLVSIIGSITTVATLATAAGAGIMGLVSSLVTMLGGGIRVAFSAIGTHIVGGIVDGIRGGVGSMTSAVTDLGSSAIASIRLALGIHSPSRVFADLVGAQIPAGIAMGVTANSGVANDAVSNIVSPRVPALGGGGSPVSITIEVNGATQPAETARAVRAELEDALGSIFGQWAEATP